MVAMKRLKNFYSGKINIVLWLVLLGVIVYYLFRPLEAIILIISLSTFIGIQKFTTHTNRRILLDNKKLIVVLFALSFLVYSFFNTRTYSYDGLNTHIRIAKLVKDKGFVSTALEPTKPYFGEFLMGKVWGVAGLRTVNLIFGILTVLGSFLSYLLIRKLGIVNRKMANVSFCLLISSPMFVAMATLEFKVDLILFVIVQTILLLLLQLSSDTKIWVYPIIGLLNGVGLIIKTSYIPTAIIVFLMSSFIVFKKRGFGGFLVMFFVTLCFSLLPLVIWIKSFGFTLPLFENTIKVRSTRDVSESTIVLERDPIILNECYSEKISKDYSSFIYGARSPLVLIQPLFYITKFKFYPFSTQPMANPGPFLYFGVFLLLLTPLLYSLKKLTRDMMYIYIISAFTLVVFFVFVSSIYWYLFFLLPVFSITVTKFVFNSSHTKPGNILYYLLYSSIGANFIIALSFAGLYFNPIKDYSYENIQGSHLESLYISNKFIESLSNEGYILNASEHPDWILLPFMDNSDTKVVRSNYYFISSRKSLSEINEVFKKNNIKYILVNYESLKSDWYEGCPGENNEMIIKYIDKFTVPVKVANEDFNTYIFKIK